MDNVLRKNRHYGLIAIMVLFIGGCGLDFDTAEETALSTGASNVVSSGDANQIFSMVMTGMETTGATAPDYRVQRVTMPINASISCTVSGLMSVSGNITVNDQTGDGSAQLNFTFGNPTNNLSDCEFSSGLFVDGTIYMNMTISSSSVSFNMDGTLEINERGPTGGLMLLESCRIFLSGNNNGVSGTVCGHPVSG